MTAAVKKRKLYRQLTGTEVPWFPHDNDIELLKELCHEAGKPRWVYFGTPAGGAGIHGCIESGCSVLALTFNDHHRTTLQPFLVERAVEAMLAGNTMIFMNETLQERSVKLRLTKKEDTPSKEDPKDAKKDVKKDEKKEDKKEDKKKGKKAEKSKNKRKSKKKADADSSSTSESESTSSGDDTPKKKKPKTEKD